MNSFVQHYQLVIVDYHLVTWKFLKSEHINIQIILIWHATHSLENYTPLLYMYAVMSYQIMEIVYSFKHHIMKITDVIRNHYSDAKMKCLFLSLDHILHFFSIHCS